MGPDRVRSRLRHAAPRALRTQGARRLRDAEELLLSEHAALNPDLGLDSISFPTFGWERVGDEPDERVWSTGDGTYRSLNFFPKPPDLPSLDTRDLGPLFGTRRRTITTRPLLIELAVERGGTPPLVRIITRPERTAADGPRRLRSVRPRVGRGAPDLLDPLTTIRHSLPDIEAAVAFRPEVASEPPFS